MILLNLSHPLTPDQVAQIERLTGAAIARTVAVPTQLDHHAPFAPQIAQLVEACGLDAQEWQTEAILVLPPALNFAAVLLLAELHGRMGYFPPCVRLRPVEGALPPRYEVAEILNLQAQRDAARVRR